MLINRKLLGCACAGVALMAMGTAQADGNRYDRDRYYHKEISVSEAYLAMEHSKGWDNRANRGQPKPVLIDVRTLTEYAAGHPEDAYNVPFPRLESEIGGPPTAADLYWAVYNIVNGDLDTPVMLLCRTGSRSIRAGNVLANPESEQETEGLMPFTNVTNIWEGYVGLYRYGFVGGKPDPDRPLDLNNDGEMNEDFADVYVEQEDANPDKDGWRNFAGLPWTTKIRRPLAYMENPGLYAGLNLTPVQ